MDRRLMPLRRVVQLGEGFLVDRNDSDVVSLRTRRFQHEKREAAVPSDDAEIHRARPRLFIGNQFLGTARRPAQDDTALGRPNEVEQVANLGRGE